MMQRLTAWRRSADRLLTRAAGIALCSAAIGVTSACGGSTTDVEKAQIAVRANPALELVATDERQAVLTVKVKRSGRTLTVTAADVIGGVAFRDLDAESPGEPLTVQRNAPGTSRVDATTSGGTASVGQSGVDASTPGGQVSIRSGGGGISVSGAGGQVKVGGGSVGAQANSGRRGAAAVPERPGSTSAAPSGDGRGAVIDESRLEQRSRPVACTGDNNVTLSNVLLRVDGVAVQGVGSCDIRIRNSHIIGDVAVQVTGSTNVAIENSIIEGRVALSLTGSADMSVKSSTIRGPVQRIGSTQLKDLGGNVWP